MFGILKKFFDFCNKENRNKFYLSIFIGIVNSLFQALRIVAVAIMLRGIIYHVQGIKTFSTSVICQAVLVTALSVVGAIITKKIMSMQQTEAGYRTCAQKRIEIAEHLRYLPMGYFNANSLGKITSVTTNTMEQVGDIATRAVMMVMQGILDSLLIIAMIFFFDWRIALISLTGFVLFQLVNFFMRLNVKSATLEKRESDTCVVEKVLEYIQGISEVKAYNLTGKSSNELNEVINRNIKANIGMELKCIPLSSLQSLVSKFTGVAIVVSSLLFCINGTMDIANGACMIVCSFMLFTALEVGGNYSALLRTIEIGVDKANEILSLPTMDIDGTALSVRGVSDSPKDIEAKNISFSYDTKKIIDDISLCIPAKTSVAFVGPSGGGKTTLCHLLSRFWDVNNGDVMLGGINVKDYSMDDLMQNFSFVFQNVYLFHDTIANNIRFGEPNAPLEKVVEAAKKAACHEFISALPQGYDTVIGEGGSSLSGGEKQRISIARAIMKDSPIIVLDEATANVDPENERELMSAISSLTKDKTVIMIAHRLKTVRNAEQIFVIDKGRIVETGKHEELIKLGGIYSRFVASREKAVSWKL